MSVINIQIKPLSKASALYLVSTPIGNMADITIRALQVLQSADVIYSEDTRQTQKLLHHYGISAKLEIYNDHNAKFARPKILDLLASNQMVALVSDAGTPLISDPGYKLCESVVEAGYKIVPIPGASSVLAGLVGSNMATDQFHFCGFVDDKKFSQLASVKSTLVFFESPRRLVKTLESMAKKFAGRSVCVARELTKIYEEFIRGSFEEVIKHYQTHEPLGEAVIILSPPSDVAADMTLVKKELTELLKTYKLKDASEILAEKYNISKKEVYALGIEKN
jgi:16S rRNA (cytidine1402-2'-O)-methyltransferase